MKKLIKYIKNFTLKSPCDECITLPICKEIHCDIEDNYFKKREQFLDSIYKIAIVGMTVFICLNIAHIYLYTETRLEISILFWIFQLTTIICQIYKFLITQTLTKKFKIRRSKLEHEITWLKSISNNFMVL